MIKRILLVLIVVGGVVGENTNNSPCLCIPCQEVNNEKSASFWILCSMPDGQTGVVWDGLGSSILLKHNRTKKSQQCVLGIDPITDPKGFLAVTIGCSSHQQHKKQTEVMHPFLPPFVNRTFHIKSSAVNFQCVSYSPDARPPHAVLFLATRLY